MPALHILIGVLVAAIWGINFIFIKLALIDFPPITLVALRFLFVVFPAVLFIPRPKVKLKSLLGYGIAMFALQFAFMFSGMRYGMSAGLASMVLQIQVFFTMAMSAVLLKEAPSKERIFGAVIAFSGVAVVGLHSDQDVNPIGLTMLLCAALSWATGTIVAKSMGTVKPLSVVVWGGLAALPVLMGLAWTIEGTEVFHRDFATLHAATFFSLAYIVYVSTHLGFSLWGWLLNRYPASTVAPFTLLVPVFGFLSSALFLDEVMSDWKVAAACLVVTGLAINMFGGRLMSRKMVRSR